jgi:hypothetical protein
MVYRDPSKRYYSEAEAADYLGITKKMLARRRYQKKVDFIKDGHLILYELRHLDAYTGRFNTAPAPEPEPNTAADARWRAEFLSKSRKGRPIQPAKPSKRKWTVPKDRALKFDLAAEFLRESQDGSKDDDLP